MLDRDAIARGRRRRELEEALVDEADRERALRDQVEAVVLEAEGSRLDAALRAALAPADLELLADVLGPAEAPDDDPWGEDWEIELDPLDHDAELERLAAEVDASAARQAALARAIELLEHPLPAPDPAPDPAPFEEV